MSNSLLATQSALTVARARIEGLEVQKADLLAALENAVKYAARADVNWEDEARAAIAKAKGEQDG